jgi:lipopolysaccharide transport system permease protein
MGYLGGLTLALVPLAAIGLVLVGTTVGLFLVPIAALYTDISKGLPLLMQFLMYTTPVIYAIPKEGLAKTVIENNPLTPLIVVTRDWLTGTPTDFLMPFLYVMIGTFVVLCIVLVVFRLAIPILVERMNA